MALPAGTVGTQLEIMALVCVIILKTKTNVAFSYALIEDATNYLYN